MKTVEIKVVNNGKQRLPEYADSGSAGMDLRANIDEPQVLKPFSRALIPTGLHIQLPDGFEAQIRSRSGLAMKHGIVVLNSPGTIDASYRGEVGVVLCNMSGKSFAIEPGDRIAQMVINEYTTGVFVPVEKLDKSERDGGFGHTGVK